MNWMMKNSREIDSFLEAICQATLNISQVGNLPEMLQRIADTARELLAADFAVLATFELENLSQNFVFSGIDQPTADLIEHLPHGIGLLGVLSDEQEVVRLPHVSEHPQFTGFPANHPEMSSFLGLPIKQNDLVYGRIYLANKTDDHPFTIVDEQLLRIFAAHAAVAIHNAQLIESSRDDRQQLEQRNRQLAALDKATMAIVGELTLDKVLQQIVDVARESGRCTVCGVGCSQ